MHRAETRNLFVCYNKVVIIIVCGTVPPSTIKKKGLGRERDGSGQNNNTTWIFCASVRYGICVKILWVKTDWTSRMQPIENVTIF